MLKTRHVSRTEQEVLDIAKAFMLDSPGTTPQKALRHAKDIYRNRGRYKVTSGDKVEKGGRTPWNRLPEHVRRTIARQQQAAAQREADGRELPKAIFVQGGRVSPK